MKVIGKEFKTGEFKGFPYSTIVVYCTAAMKQVDKAAEGEKVYVMKIKKQSLEQYNAIPIGKDIAFRFDYFGNIVDYVIE